MKSRGYIQHSAREKFMKDTGLKLGVKGKIGFKMAKVENMYYGKGNIT